MASYGQAQLLPPNGTTEGGGSVLLPNLAPIGTPLVAAAENVQPSMAACIGACRLNKQCSAVWFCEAQVGTCRQRVAWPPIRELQAYVPAPTFAGRLLQRRLQSVSALPRLPADRSGGDQAGYGAAGAAGCSTHIHGRYEAAGRARWAVLGGCSQERQLRHGLPPFFPTPQARHCAMPPRRLRAMRPIPASACGTGGHEVGMVLASRRRCRPCCSTTHPALSSRYDLTNCADSISQPGSCGLEGGPQQAMARCDEDPACQVMVWFPDGRDYPGPGKPVVLLKGGQDVTLDITDANINLNAVLYKKMALHLEGAGGLTAGAIAGLWGGVADLCGDRQCKATGSAADRLPSSQLIREELEGLRLVLSPSFRWPLAQGL